MVATDHCVAVVVVVHVVMCCEGDDETHEAAVDEESKHVRELERMHRCNGFVPTTVSW